MPRGSFVPLPLEAWDLPEERHRRVGEALATWNERLLAEGVWAYLVRHRKKPDPVVPHMVERFVLWLAQKGRRWPALEAGDIRAYLLEIKERGFPGGPKGPLAPATVERARGALGYLWPFLEWAGHPMPPHVEYPPRRFALLSGRVPLPEEAWERLWRKAEEFNPAHWRPLLRVLLVLLGEVGLSLREASDLWRDDLKGERLVVRGRSLREVPLSPLAQATLRDWLPLRDYLAGHQPIPYPHLLLNPAPTRSRGKPLPYPILVQLLQELAQLAGYREEGKARNSLSKRLRWRAIRRYLQAGYPRDKVAYWTGMRSLGAGLGLEDAG
ncbi:site-specific integrase [Thermus caldifontis]|uniref:site-specific integrase n=1 Tax=Thermus caldifontis TaxID=1930763 RepID=UPI000DF3F46B|nr:site-specific integrase [Thermus caldifontis]